MVCRLDVYLLNLNVSEFPVVVQRTDAATRCDLQGAYLLQVGQEALLLRDAQKKSVVQEWPYEMLRRYGKDKVKESCAGAITGIKLFLKGDLSFFFQLVLTIEAGRRCDSGPGSFVFETPQAENIFFMIQATIKQKTSPQNQECHAPANTLPFPRSPEMANMAAALHVTLKMQDRKFSPSEDSPHAPITLMPLPSIPTNSSYAGSQAEAVYADPVDCIQSEPDPRPVKALYVDPATFLPIHPPGSKQSPASAPSDPSVLPERQDSVYSEVFDKVCAAEAKDGRSSRDEPIYAEPVCEKVSPARSRPDPFAHLYAQVRKVPAASGPAFSTNAGPSCSSATSPTLATPDQADDDDVIYENMGII